MPVNKEKSLTIEDMSSLGAAVLIIIMAVLWITPAILLEPVDSQPVTAWGYEVLMLGAGMVVHQMLKGPDWRYRAGVSVIPISGGLTYLMAGMPIATEIAMMTLKGTAGAVVVWGLREVVKWKLVKPQPESGK